MEVGTCPVIRKHLRGVGLIKSVLGIEIENPVATRPESSWSTAPL